MKPSKVTAELLKDFEPIGLSQMDEITLMNRVDTKYVCTERQLEALLKLAQKDYFALETESGKTTVYDTMYFDTPEQEMYMVHHSGRLIRKKVRVRTYVCSGATFLEVKRKNNHRRTKKKRMEVPQGCLKDFSSAPGAAEFLLEKSGYNPEDLSPALETRFDRITLVNKTKTERVTIDTNLTFCNQRSGAEADMKGLAIIELKQDGRAASQMKKILSELRIHELRISKYCIGTAMSNPAIKQNRFKEKITIINKLRYDSSTACGL